MKQIDNILTPSEGYVLTQAAETDLENRIVTSRVILAANDSPSNWREITLEEANKLIEKQQENFNKKINIELTTQC